MGVEEKDETHREEECIAAYVCDGLVIEEDVSVDLRVLENEVQKLEISLILEVLVCLALAFVLPTV